MLARVCLSVAAVLALAGTGLPLVAARPAAAQQEVGVLAAQKAQVMAFIFALDVSGFHELDTDLSRGTLGPGDLARAVEPTYRTRIGARAIEWPQSFRAKALELIDALDRLEVALRASDAQSAQAPGRAVHVVWHDLQDRIYGWLRDNPNTAGADTSVPQAVQAAQVIAVVHMLERRDFEQVESSLAAGRVIPGTLGAVRQSRSPVRATDWPEPLRAKALDLDRYLDELERPVRDEKAGPAVEPAGKVRQAERELVDQAYNWLGSLPSAAAAEPLPRSTQTAQMLAISFVLGPSGFERLDNALAAGAPPPGALRTVSQARTAVLATTWPEPLRPTASDLGLALADLEDALRVEDVGRAALSSGAARGTWRALAEGLDTWLNEAPNPTLDGAPNPRVCPPGTAPVPGAPEHCGPQR